MPEPPLRLDPDWLVAGLGVAAVMLAALLVAEAASLAAFRGDAPRTRLLEPRMTLAIDVREAFRIHRSAGRPRSRSRD